MSTDGPSTSQRFSGTRAALRRTGEPKHAARQRRGLRSAVAVTLAVPLLAGAALTLSTTAASAAVPPAVLQVKTIGHSVDGRAINAYEMGDPRSTHKVLVIGQIHGDEHAGVTVASTILHGKPVGGVDMWVVPTVNPDGDAHHTHGNAHGVDLNRNWPHLWARLPKGYHWSGPKALSEPETRATLKFLQWLNPSLTVSIHQPLYGVDTTDGGHRNPAFARRLATNLHLPLKAFRCFSTCHGSMTGWMTANQHGSADTVEFGSHPGNHTLTEVAPRGIIDALRGYYVTRASRNPVAHISSATGSGGQVHLVGWAYDPDTPSSPKTVAVLINGHVVKRVLTDVYRADVNAAHTLTKNHGFTTVVGAGAGRHQVCVRAYNVRIGTGPSTVCNTVTVRA